MIHPRFRPSILSAAILAVLTALPLALAAQSIATNSPVPLSTRVTSYDIDARLDTDKKTLDAAEVVTYKNLTGQPLSSIPFHLYLNAFRPQSTFSSETHFTGGIRDSETDNDYPSEKLGSIDISKIAADGYGDLTGSMHFIAPDDGNMQDHTVMEIALPHPLAPGATITFHLVFHDKFPLSIARNGYKRDFIMGGQWYPKPGVFWHGAWNCHQYHNTTEFFADFGVYDVKLTVPQFEIVGASGVKVSEANNADNTKTLTYHGDDIHDFAWTASPRYKVKDDGVFQGQMGPVRMRILMQPAHWSQVERHEKILRESLDHFERWYGPYPYKTITLVDPEPDSAAGGMEYPTFITGETSWFMPEGLHMPELVVEHVFGHQYWYGMVATNEFEDAWMDEGINSYTEVKVLDSILGKNTSIWNMAGVTMGERELQRVGYIGVADLDPIAKNAYEYYNSGSYAGITYGKTASVLLTLESIIGEDTMAKAMHVYFMKYRFTHPTKEDFLKTIEEVSGKDLRWYFNQAIYGVQVMDYKVLRTESLPVNWYDEKKNASKDDKDTVYRSYVWLQRKEDFVMPVDVQIKFENGETIREHWDGINRWTRLGPYEKKTKIESAEIDPDHKIQIDRNDFNNSYTAEAHGKPARKVSNYWMFATQWVSQALAWWGV